MKMKICTKCNKEKDLDDFSWKDRAKGRKASECKSCHREMRKAYYENNKEKERARVRERKKKLAIWFKELKSSLKCSRCPESHVSTLQFHHLNSAEKESDLAKVVRMGWSKERILEEISKCEVLCASCHAKEHWKD